MTAPDDAAPSDLELRGTPFGLPSPVELEAQHPDGIFVVAYSRISDDWRKHNRKKAAVSSWKAGKGVANQHRRNDMNASRHGLIIVYRFTDNDLTASKLEVVRPDFQAMINVLRRGRTPDGYRVDGAICVDQDRVQRTGRDWEDFVEALTLVPSRRFWTPSGSMDLSEEGDVIKAGVMAVVNKAESMKKRRRTRDWHQDRILDGLPHSGPRPFGWDDDRLALRPFEADFLAWAIRERIRGKAMGTLCAEAARRGLTGTKGGKIVSQTLTQMMTAPRVCGYRANRGELVMDAAGTPLVGIWKPIVEPEEWQQVCATFGPGSTYLARGTGAPRITGAPKTVKYLASGLLRCLVQDSQEQSGETFLRACNKALVGSPTKSRTSPHVYVCRCGRNAISGPMVDKQVERLLLAKLLQAKTNYRRPEVAWPGELELKQKANRLRELENQWNAGVVSDEMFYRLAPPLDLEVKALRRKRARWEADSSAGSEPPGDILTKWNRGDYDLAQKRKILFEAFAAIQVKPGVKGKRSPDPHRLTPVWKE